MTTAGDDVVKSGSTLSATFAFVDLAGYTALTEAHGPHAAADCVEHFVGWTRELLPADGRLIDRVGDAVFVMTPTPVGGVRFVRTLFERAAHASDFPILRAGLHHGEALERSGSFFGTAVNVAARIAAQARGGQVLGTESIATAAVAAAVTVHSIGSVSLKNVRDPIELFDIEVATVSGSASAIDPVCRMRVARESAPGRLRFNGSDYWFCSMTCAAQFSAAPETYASTRGTR